MLFMHSFALCFVEKSPFLKGTMEQTGLWLVLFAEYWHCSLPVALHLGPKTLK
jgi:hypothetical protein